MNKINICLLLSLFFLFACGDFLEEQSQDLTYATSCKDLDELLIGGGYLKHYYPVSDLSASNEKTDPYFPWIHVMDDDVEELTFGALNGRINQPRETVGAFYRWEKDPCNVEGAYYEDITWKRLYRHLGVVNVVLEKADEFADDPEEERLSVKGQAYFLRATYYYLLVNLYAKPYSEVSASVDLGVPMKLSTHVEDKNWTRPPVDSVYHQIVKDLQSAITCLAGTKMKSVHRANEDAARVLLSRVYCYMGRWDLVPELCDEVLKKEYSLLDLNNPGDAKLSGLTYLGSPETIFTQGANSIYVVFNRGQNSYGSSFRVSEELSASFKDAGDLRPSFIFGINNYTKSDIYPQKWKFNSQRREMVSDNFLIRLPEVYLNKAEALAMTGKEGEAKNVLQELRARRFEPSKLGEIEHSGGELVNFIREERRRELCFEGHRWFDLRRYAVSSKYPQATEIRHKRYKHTTNMNAGVPGIYQGYYLLRRYPASGWVLPIPGYEIEQNDGKMINNEREDCSFLK